LGVLGRKVVNKARARTYADRARVRALVVVALDRIGKTAAERMSRSPWNFGGGPELTVTP